LDEILKRTKKSDDPFGGIKLIVVGDFCQLPPVSKASVYDWAFKCKAWKEASIKILPLHKSYRQTDKAWIDCLNDVRVAKITSQTQRLLDSRAVSHHPADFDGTFLLTHNEQVRNHNAQKLKEVHGEQRSYHGICSGKEHKIEQLIATLTTPRILELKVGAKIIATINDREGNFYNGSTGKVVKMMPEKIDVFFDDSKQITPVTRFSFNDENRNVAQEWKKKSITTMRQFPLKLGWATSIHQAQGTTLSKCFIDATHVFASHMTYVAMSRCKTLEGLSIKGFDRSKVYVDLEARKFYEKIALENPVDEVKVEV